MRKLFYDFYDLQKGSQLFKADELLWKIKELLRKDFEGLLNELISNVPIKGKKT